MCHRSTALGLGALIVVLEERECPWANRATVAAEATLIESGAFGTRRNLSRVSFSSAMLRCC